jgi:hypothetical protein
MLALNEHSGHQDLRGSGRRSVIHYVHGRMGVVLLKRWIFSWLPCVALRVLTPAVTLNKSTKCSIKVKSTLLTVIEKLVLDGEPEMARRATVFSDHLVKIR